MKPKQRITFQLLAISILSFGALKSLVKAQEPRSLIRIDDVEVAVAKIPAAGPLVVKAILDTIPYGGERALRSLHVKVFRSSEKNIFGKVTTANLRNYIGSTDHIEQTGTSTLEIINTNGELIWKQTREVEILNCRISANAMFVHVVWADVWKGIKELVSYDSNGNKIRAIDKVRSLYVSNNGEVVYYDYFEHGNWEIGCIDFPNKQQWQKNLPAGKSALLDISGDGSRIVGFADDKLYSWSIKGEELWAKMIDIRPGFMDLSFDGRYLLRLPDYGKVELYDNRTGDLIWTKQSAKLQGTVFRPYMGKFVEPGHTIALTDFLGDRKTGILFVDIEGRILDLLELERRYRSDFSIVLTTPKSIEVNFDGLLAYRHNIEWK